MAKRRRPKPAVSASLKKTLADLVAAAGAGRADLGWLDKAIRKAGYVPVAECLSAKDVDVAAARIVRAIERTLDREQAARVEEAIAEMDAGR